MPRDTVPAFQCPLPSALNPNVLAIDRRTALWLRRHRLLSAPGELTEWLGARYGWLPSRCHPNASFEDVALVADWYAWLFMFDDLGDRSRLGVTPAELRRRGERFLATLSSLSSGGDEEDPLERALRDWGRRLVARREARVWLPRFLGSVRTYFDALVWEARNRTTGVVPTVEEYLRMRLDTGAVKTCFIVGELVEGVCLPDAAWDRPEVQTLTATANRLVCFQNDVVSGHKEVAVGEVHNYAVLLQHHEGLARDEAIAVVIERHNRDMHVFLTACAELPDLGDDAANAHLRRYVRMLGRWICANLDWSFECGRYRAGVRSLAAPERGTVAC